MMRLPRIGTPGNTGGGFENDLAATRPQHLSDPNRQPHGRIVEPAGPLRWTARLLEELQRRLYAVINRQVYFTVTPINVGVVALRLRPEEPERRYLLVQNLHQTQTLCLGFGREPANALDGIVLNPSGVAGSAGGSFEPAWVPCDELFVIGSAGATVGMLVVATPTRG